MQQWDGSESGFQFLHLHSDCILLALLAEDDGAMDLQHRPGNCSPPRSTGSIVDGAAGPREWRHSPDLGSIRNAPPRLAGLGLRCRKPLHSGATLFNLQCHSDEYGVYQSTSYCSYNDQTSPPVGCARTLSSDPPTWAPASRMP